VITAAASSPHRRVQRGTGTDTLNTTGGTFTTVVTILARADSLHLGTSGDVAYAPKSSGKRSATIGA
jgi:hypothetical protein